MLREIVLIEPTLNKFSALGTFCRHSSLDPIACEYLAAAIKKDGYQVKITKHSEFSKKTFSKEGYEYNLDVVGFSVMTYNFMVAKNLAKEIKLHNPKVFTIFGGYYASARPTIVKDENIDFVIIGEGERTFIELLDILNSNGDITKVKGIAYWDNGLHINPQRERIENLDKLPFPIRGIEFLKDSKIGGLVYPPPSKQISVCQITYSRGCPYNCTFCNSPQLWGKQVRWRSAKNLVDEIEYLQQKFGTNMVFFTDLTFDLNKTKVYELCNEIRNRGIDIDWFPMCRVDHVDKDLLVAMKEAGCTKISYGIDSISNVTLSKIKPRQNINLGKIKSALELTSDVGIIVRAYVMIGYPWEDKESLQETKEILKVLPIDDLRISFLTPFPGTTLYDEFKKEGLLITEDFSRYTSDEPIVKGKGLSQEELIEIRERIFEKFYNSKEYEMRKKDKLKKFPHLMKSYEEFFEFLHSKKVLR